MNRRPKSDPEPLAQLLKCPSGITGLDEITNGGIPRGRPTLICGPTGSGKTLFAMEFLVRGIQQHNEPGVFMSFEEHSVDLAQNVASLGFDLPALIDDKKLFIDHVAIDRSEIEETGEYSLDGLFVRLGAAIDEVGAKRIVLDTIEILFASLTNQSILRAELRRLFAWIKEKGVTAIVTGERGDEKLTRNGLEEYVSDCVILLDNRVERVATRRLRIIKYRGSAHGSNEYPFLIDEQGFTVLPITAIGLHYPAARDIISTGIPKLDAMFGGNGYFRGGTLLVSGGAGTGKSSIAVHFIDAACQRGERCIYFAFEESPDQILRNMRSIGIDLDPWRQAGTLRFAASRPASLGLEVHLFSGMLKLLDDFKPQVVVLDPVSSFDQAGGATDALAMLMRMVDLMKLRGITALFTSLTSAEPTTERSETGISSLIDTWLILRNLELAGERTRTLSIIKSRGMKHSNRARELLLTDNRIDLAEVFIGPDGKILTGSARDAQEMVDRAATMALKQDIANKRDALARKQTVMTTRIAEMQAELAAETDELEVTIGQQEAAASALTSGRATLARGREQSIGTRPL